LRVVAFEGPAAAWDAVAGEALGGTQCHAFGWKRIIERVHRHECVYLACQDEGGIVRGILPLVRVQSRVFGHYLVSMPFLNYGGPLGDRDAVRALTTRAVELAAGSGVDLLELRSCVPLALDLPVSHRKITVLMDVPDGGPERLWGALSAKLRSQIRRPQKEGVVVRFGADQVGPFYDVFARHMRDLGTPVQPCRLFEAIVEQFPQDAWFGCAYLREQPIAAGAGFRWGGEFEMTWASALRAHSRIAPNMLLYWAFMTRCAEQGIRVFNFGRCTPGSGTHRFKGQWGGRDQELHWYQWSRGGTRSTPSPASAKFRAGTWVWQRLPVTVATRLGPAIVRLIP